MPEQVGSQEFKFSYREGANTFFDTRWCIVLSKETAAPAGGNAAKLAQVMRMPLQDPDEGFYSANPAFRDCLVFDGNHLTVTGADGIAPLRTLPLENRYSRIGERSDYFVGVRPQAVDLIDKQTGKIIKSIPV